LKGFAKEADEMTALVVASINTAKAKSPEVRGAVSPSTFLGEAFFLLLGRIQFRDRKSAKVVHS